MKAPMPFPASRLLVFACAVLLTESAQAQLVADGAPDTSSHVATQVTLAISPGIPQRFYRIRIP